MKVFTRDRYLSRLRSGSETVLSTKSHRRPMKTNVDVKVGVPFSGCQGTFRDAILFMISSLS